MATDCILDNPTFAVYSTPYDFWDGEQTPVNLEIKTGSRSITWNSDLLADISMTLPEAIALIAALQQAVARATPPKAPRPTWNGRPIGDDASFDQFDTTPPRT